MNPITKVVSALRYVANHPVNRNRKVRAVMEYGFIQIAARMVPGDVCVKFPNSTRLLVSPHMKGAAHFITPPLCEFEDMAFLMHFLRPEETFCDVGANIGAFSVLASGVTGAKSVAFEPSPETFEMLQRNIRLNDLTNRARTVWAVVGGQRGTAQFSSGLGTENYVVKSDGGKTVAVPMTTLDYELATTPATVLKVDVEGFETEVFSGGKQTLKNPTLLAIIVERNGAGNRYGYDEAALHEEIRSYGFKPHGYAPFTRTLHPIGNNDVGNIIYIRDFAAASERLRSATTFEIGGLKV